MSSPAASLYIVVDAQTGKASRDLSRFDKRLAATARSADRSAGVINGVTKGLKLLGTAAAAGAAYGLYKGVTAGAQFEKQIDTLGSVTKGTTKQMKAFEKQALALGESTQYTANQVAEAQTELAKGGFTTKQILGGGLKTALALAAAGQLELAEAAETTTGAVTTFSLKAKESMLVADALATAAQKTNADVSDFAMAFKQGGGAVAAAGGDFDEAVTILEAMSKALNVEGSDAGTSMKTALVKLAEPLGRAKDLTKELNLEFFNQNGELKSAVGISKELTRVLDEKTGKERLAALQTLAGTDGFRSLLALYEIGPEKLRQWEQANEKAGTAQKVAAERTDNLTGDVEELGGALETKAIEAFKKFGPAIRTATQAATDFIRELGHWNVQDIAQKLGISRKELKQFEEAARNAADIFKRYVWPVIKTVLEVLVRLMKDFAIAVRGVVKVISGILRGDFGQAWQGVKDIFSAGADGALAIVKGITKPIRTIGAAVGEGLADAFSGAWDKIEGIFSDGVDAIARFIQSIANVINPLLDAVGIGEIHITGSSQNLEGEHRTGKKGFKQEHRQRGGAMFGGKPSGDSIPALLERGEYVLNRNAVQKVGTRHLDALNFGSAPRFQLGGPIGMISGGDIFDAAKDVAGFTPPGLAFKAGRAAFETAKNAADLITALPSAPNLPGIFGDIASGVLDKVKDWIGGLPASVFGGGGGSISGGNIVAVGKSLQKMGYEIGEHPAFGGVTAGAHVANSAHYSGRAFDVNDDASPYGHGSSEMESLDWLAPKLDKLPHSQIIWRNHDWDTGTPISGHMDHLHFAMQRGGAIAALLKGLQAGGYTGNINHTWAEHNSGSGDWGGPTLPPYVIAALAEAAGDMFNPAVPGWTMEQITKGESAGRPGSSSADHGYGLWAITAPYNDSLVSKYGGYKEMLNPVKNAAVMAQIFDPATAFGPIWHGDSFVTSRTAHYEGNYDIRNALGGVSFKEALTGKKGTAAESDEHTFKEDVPAEWGGVWAGKSLNLPSSTPKDLKTINTELRQRRAERTKYRKAAERASAKKRPAIAQAIQHNVTTLEGRIRELERAQVKARVETATKNFKGKLGEQLGKLTRLAKPIAEAERGFNAQQQYTEQVVGLEPVEGAPPKMDLPPLPSLDGLDKAGREKAKEKWEKDTREAERSYGKRREGEEQGFAQTFANYVQQREGGAFAKLLSKAADWRNSILGAEHTAAGPWQKAKTLGGLEGHWEDKIISTGNQIENAERLVKVAPEKLADFTKQFRENHKGEKPGAKDYPPWLTKLLSAADKAKNEELPILTSADRELRKVLGEGQAEFYPGKSRIRERPTPPLAGSGALEQALENVQGIHWPEQHELLKQLPTVPLEGKFGGVIWDVQNQIQELGLKASSAFESLSAAGIEWPEEEGESAAEVVGKTPREERLEEMLREANQSRLVFERQAPILEKFAGFKAAGGVIPSGQWGIAGEAGPEIVHGPAQVYSNSQSAGMVGAAAPQVRVEVFEGHADKTKVYVNEQEVEAIIDRKNRIGGRGAKTVGARVAGRRI